MSTSRREMWLKSFSHISNRLEMTITRQTSYLHSKVNHSNTQTVKLKMCDFGFGLLFLSIVYVILICVDCYSAVGCSNLVPPSDAWLRRTENEATIGCYTTRQRWNLRCDGNQWKGTIGVCSQGGRYFGTYSLLEMLYLLQC